VLDIKVDVITKKELEVNTFIQLSQYTGIPLLPCGMGSSHSMGSSLALHFKIQIICLMVCSSSYKRLWIFFVVYNIKKVLEQASEEFSFDQVLCARPLSSPSMYVQVCS
jgi:hypothetical protein